MPTKNNPLITHGKGLVNIPKADREVWKMHELIVDELVNKRIELTKLAANKTKGATNKLKKVNRVLSMFMSADPYEYANAMEEVLSANLKGDALARKMRLVGDAMENSGINYDPLLAPHHAIMQSSSREPLLRADLDLRREIQQIGKQKGYKLSKVVGINPLAHNARITANLKKIGYPDISKLDPDVLAKVNKLMAHSVAGGYTQGFPAPAGIIKAGSAEDIVGQLVKTWDQSLLATSSGMQFSDTVEKAYKASKGDPALFNEYIRASKQKVPTYTKPQWDFDVPAPKSPLTPKQITLLTSAGLIAPGFVGLASSAAETKQRASLAIRKKDPLQGVQAGLSAVSGFADLVSAEPVSATADSLNLLIDHRRNYQGPVGKETIRQAYKEVGVGTTTDTIPTITAGPTKWENRLRARRGTRAGELANKRKLDQAVLNKYFAKQNSNTEY